ncbi:MAG: hypothetical protein ABSF72_00395 [Candidatus Sulfotelmatobacter sp.]|jgi:hypothetical protein
MTHPLEYHIPVRPLVPASLALFGMLLLASSSPAQNTSAASSSAGHTISTTTTAHVSANSGFNSSTRTPHSTTSSHGNNNGPQRTTSIPLPYYYYPYVYAIPVPYTADVIDNGASDDNDPNYQGGPTVFDRRGDGPSSYIPPGYESPAESIAAQMQAEDTPPADYDSDSQPSPDPTVLVFKDGHQLEVGNYAIVNQTVYDLTPGHPRKIALADLDLAATQKLNDDHGITFGLPSSAQAN